MFPFNPIILPFKAPEPPAAASWYAVLLSTPGHQHRARVESALMLGQRSLCLSRRFYAGSYNAMNAAVAEISSRAITAMLRPSRAEARISVARLAMVSADTTATR
jgi:hypothetical protein